MAGVPLLNGFLSKEMFFAEAFEAGKGSPARPGRRTWVALIASELQRRLLAALHPPGLLRPAAHGPAARAARAAALDALPGRDPGGGLPRRRHRPGDDDRALPAHGGGLGARAGDARLQPRALARHQRAAGHERGRARRRHGALRAAGRPARPRAPRGRRCCGCSRASASSSAASSPSGGAGRARSTG